MFIQKKSVQVYQLPGHITSLLSLWLDSLGSTIYYPFSGKPQLQLNQLLTSFFFHDTKYTIKMVEVERGLLAKHPDNIQAEPDLMT